MKVKIKDSADGHNPVFILNYGDKTLQLDKYNAKKLANKLSEKVDKLEENNESWSPPENGTYKASWDSKYPVD